MPRFYQKSFLCLLVLIFISTKVNSQTEPTGAELTPIDIKDSEIKDVAQQIGEAIQPFKCKNLVRSEHYVYPASIVLGQQPGTAVVSPVHYSASRGRYEYQQQPTKILRLADQVTEYEINQQKHKAKKIYAVPRYIERADGTIASTPDFVEIYYGERVNETLSITHTSNYTYVDPVSGERKYWNEVSKMGATLPLHGIANYPFNAWPGVTYNQQEEDRRLAYENTVKWLKHIKWGSQEDYRDIDIQEIDHQSSSYGTPLLAYARDFYASDRVYWEECQPVEIHYYGSERWTECMENENLSPGSDVQTEQFINCLVGPEVLSEEIKHTRSVLQSKIHFWNLSETITNTAIDVAQRMLPIYGTYLIGKECAAAGKLNSAECILALSMSVGGDFAWLSGIGARWVADPAWRGRIQGLQEAAAIFVHLNEFAIVSTKLAEKDMGGLAQFVAMRAAIDGASMGVLGGKIDKILIRTVSRGKQTVRWFKTCQKKGREKPFVARNKPEESLKIHQDLPELMGKTKSALSSPIVSDLAEFAKVEVNMPLLPNNNNECRVLVVTTDRYRVGDDLNLYPLDGVNSYMNALALHADGNLAGPGGTRINVVFDHLDVAQFTSKADAITKINQHLGGANPPQVVLFAAHGSPRSLALVDDFAGIQGLPNTKIVLNGDDVATLNLQNKIVLLDACSVAGCRLKGHDATTATPAIPERQVFRNEQIMLRMLDGGAKAVVGVDSPTIETPANVVSEFLGNGMGRPLADMYRPGGYYDPNPVVLTPLPPAEPGP